MKKSLKTEITKEKILKAATEEFALRGFERATINQICQGHDISKGLVYYNFESKDELYLCCVEEAVNEFISYMKKQEFETDIKIYMKERYKFFETNPYYSRLIFEIILTENHELSEKIKDVKNRFNEFNKSIYESAIDKLKLRNGISKDGALQYYTLLQNMLSNYLSIDNTSKKGLDFVIDNHEKSLKKIIDFILYGIAQEEKQ